MKLSERKKKYEIVDSKGVKHTFKTYSTYEYFVNVCLNKNTEQH